MDVVTDGPVVALGDVAAVARQANGTSQDAGRHLAEVAGTTEHLSAAHAGGENYQATQVRGAAADRAARHAGNPWRVHSPPIGPCRSSSVGNSARGR